ncbi:MAG: hypothetical protein IKT40_08935 [Bacilli bacterium]|nr:hypothetical protein [Bacilli bacterium]
MSRKIYSMYGTAVDKDGQSHIVTVVGEYTNKKEVECNSKEVEIEVGEDKTVSGYLTVPRKQMVRTLTYAYSICCPEDKFDEAEGIRLATKRLKTNPLGELKSKYVTSLCKDQIEIILFGELKYITQNIEKFITK